MARIVFRILQRAPHLGDLQPKKQPENIVAKATALTEMVAKATISRRAISAAGRDAFYWETALGLVQISSNAWVR